MMCIFLLVCSTTSSIVPPQASPQYPRFYSALPLCTLAPERIVGQHRLPCLILAGKCHCLPQAWHDYICSSRARMSALPHREPTSQGHRDPTHENNAHDVPSGGKTASA